MPWGGPREQVSQKWCEILAARLPYVKPLLEEDWGGNGPGNRGVEGFRTSRPRNGRDGMTSFFDVDDSP